MCGIVGFNWQDKNLVKRMITSLKHRGPDDEGCFVDNEISIGNSRLAIIDFNKKARQPIWNETRTKCVVFNGEIYNFKEIKKDLEAKGHRFYSDTDTEVIVHAYEEHGKGCVNKLNGMFAFAIWDLKKKELVLARDRFGIKPLYYYAKDRAFIFSSEIKAIFKTHRRQILDKESMNYYLTLGHTPPNKTIYKDIHKLEPGHILTLKKSKLIIKKYGGGVNPPQKK